MDSFLDFLLQTLSRFLISGLVFYVIVLWIPIALLFGDGQRQLMMSPGFVLLTSLVLGLLLRVTRAYRLAFWVTKKRDLERRILRAAGIADDPSETSPHYQDECREIANELHEVYLRTRHPAEYELIRQARIGVDVLALTVLSAGAAVFVAAGIAVVGALAGALGSHGRERLILVGLFVVCSFVAAARGRSTVSRKYEGLNRYTEFLMQQALQCDGDTLDKFCAGLAKGEDALLSRAAQSGWIVRPIADSA